MSEEGRVRRFAVTNDEPIKEMIAIAKKKRDDAPNYADGVIAALQWVLSGIDFEAPFNYPKAVKDDPMQ